MAISCWLVPIIVADYSSESGVTAEIVSWPHAIAVSLPYSGHIMA